MAAAEQTYCTPYLSRTIKGWKIRVRICFGVEITGFTITAYQTHAVAVAAALGGITASTWYVGGGLEPQALQGYGTVTNDYDNAEDAAVFTFATDSGTVAKISVPNPLDSIFLADKMTVDPANANVITFLEAINAGGDATASPVGATASGAFYNTFLGGLRKRSKTRRKLNIWVRNPELTAPGI